MTDTCPPCNHDCNQGRDCPARKKTMPAPTDLAAALLRDVHRHTIRCYVDDLPCLLEADVLAALTAALDGVDERAGEVVGRLRTLGVMFDDASAAADLITAILAQNAALRAERDEARAAWEIEAATVKRFADRHERNLVLGAETRARADAAEAEVEKLRRALTNLPAVYAHQINTGVREVYDPLQRFYTMESVLAALTETATTEGRHG